MGYHKYLFNSFINKKASVQENHNLRMQLEVSQKLTSSQNADMESLKESLQISEELNKQLKALDEEQHRKESTLVSQVNDHTYKLKIMYFKDFKLK